MSIGKKVKKGALIAGGVAIGTVGLTGYSVYRAVQFVKGLLYPPTVKKYVALAALPVAFYCIEHPTTAVDGASGAFSRTGTYISETIDRWNDERVESLGKKLDEKDGAIKQLEAQNKNLERIVYQDGRTHHSNSRTGSASAAPANGGREYLEGFAGRYRDMILVDKGKNELHLLRSTGNSYVEVGKYNCTTGKNPMPKSRDGDKASPEGIFYATPESRKWNDNYTPAKLNLAMPPSMGSGIVVTGTTNLAVNSAIQRHESVSNGGIVLSAGDYMDLHSKVRNDGRLPIVITSSHTKTLLDYTRGAN